LSRGLADGVVLTGCREGNCQHRFGVDWTIARLDRKRDPQLRRRVPRERILRFWASPADGRALDKAILKFAESVSQLPEPKKRRERQSILVGASDD
jgi:coenzyme F420-reducing hydrogenase delta subunit